MWEDSQADSRGSSGGTGGKLSAQLKAQKQDGGRAEEARLLGDRKNQVPVVVRPPSL